jgi:hypothetical protein
VAGVEPGIAGTYSGGKQFGQQMPRESIREHIGKAEARLDGW